MRSSRRQGPAARGLRLPCWTLKLPPSARRSDERKRDCRKGEPRPRRRPPLGLLSWSRRAVCASRLGRARCALDAVARPRGTWRRSSRAPCGRFRPSSNRTTARSSQGASISLWGDADAGEPSSGLLRPARVRRFGPRGIPKAPAGRRLTGAKRGADSRGHRAPNDSLTCCHIFATIASATGAQSCIVQHSGCVRNYLQPQCLAVL